VVVDDSKARAARKNSMNWTGSDRLVVERIPFCLATKNKWKKIFSLILRLPGEQIFK